MRLHSLLLLVAMSPLALAQTITGTITGVVTDSSGAVIPDADVTALNLETSVRATAKTDTSGNYLMSNLPRGSYRVEVSASGFRRFVQAGITLQIQQTARVDIRLTVGEVSESIQVTADAARIETENATLAKVVDNRSIVNLPLNTRNVYSLVFLTPGVTGSVGNNYGDMRYSVNGARQRTMDTLIDGVSAAHPTVNGFAGISVFPSVDAIEEFKLLGATYPAEFGRSLGSVLNIVFKSGTNKWHGSAYEFLRNSRLDANNFFDNSRSRQLGSFKRSQFGGVFNGPIVKDKAFFMVSFEALRQRNFATTVFSVPTQLERSGNFTETRAASGALIQIFDPFTTRPNPAGAGFIRTQFPGNVIPASRINRVATNVSRFYPLPNTPPTGVTNQNNFANSGSALTDVTQSDYRFDYNISPTQRIFARYSTRLTGDGPAVFFPKELTIAEGRIVQEDHVHGGVVDYTNTLSSGTVFNARVGVARTLYVFNNQGLGFVPSSLGLPTYIDTAVDRVMFPSFGVTGYRSLGGGDHRNNGFMSYTAVASLSKIVGKHSLKFGTDLRMMRVNTFEARSAGSFSFGNGQTQGPDPNRATATAGNGYASLLVGFGSGGSLIQNFKNVATQSFYLAGHFQDDWRLTRNLSLNLGLRWDVDTPRTERYDRTNYFDPNAPLTASSALPGITGGLIFVGTGGIPRTQFGPDLNNWAPRIGLSWQMLPKTVLRMGYAHIYGPSQQAAAGTIGTMGFSSSSTWVNSLDGITPNHLINDPFPNGLTPMLGAGLGTMTQFGNQIQATTRDIVSPRTQQMNVNIQRSLPFDSVLEVAYVMTRGFQLHRNAEGGLSLNQLDPVHLSLGAALNQSVPNPFFGKFSGGILSQSTVRRAQLLRPYPQFDGVIPIYSVGASNSYNSLQVTLTKNLSRGLQFNAAYTWAKNLDQGMSHQNSYDIRSSRALADIDVLSRLVVGYVYDVPIGRGHRLGSDWPKWMDLAFGRWQLNGITTLSTGTPLNVSASNTAGIFNITTLAATNGGEPGLKGPVQERLTRFFDTSVFSQPDPFRFGSVSPRISGLRNDGTFNWDISGFKNFLLTERLKLQFRAEFLNSFNTPRFGSPNTGVTSATFGVITTQANAPRQIQFGLKLLF
ncbi:MAG: hypothetical protein FJW36_12000 [Acidobacteria bacterium]|nr:hypothetical protein [Acidobacteriota bacterium]